MQQVNSLGYRLGSTTGWQTGIYNRKNDLLGNQLNLILRKSIASRGAFLINAYFYYHRNVAFCPIVYYRYHQRSRLKRWLVGYLNRGEGLLAPPKVRYFTLYKNDMNSHKSLISRQKSLMRVFPEAGLNGYTNKALRSRAIRGWIDLEFKIYSAVKRRQADTLVWQLRNSMTNLIPRAEFSVYNIFDFVSTVNPVKATKNYILQRFSKMLYQPDVLAAIYISTQLNASNLFAHAITLGLERHGRRREQRRFLSMVRVMCERIMLWKNVENRPLWRLSIFGKLDASMRRTHYKLRVGFIRYQELDFVTNYSESISRTKFGTSSVRVWMRNLLE